MYMKNREILESKFDKIYTEIESIKAFLDTLDIENINTYKECLNTLISNVYLSADYIATGLREN